MTHETIRRWLATTDPDTPIAYAPIQLPQYVFDRSWQVQRLTPGQGWTSWHRWTGRKATARRQLREAREQSPAYRFRMMEAIAITATKEVFDDARPRTPPAEHDTRARRHARRVRP